MRFSEYWILLVAVLLVIITVINISKMIVMLSRNSSLELNRNVRNMLISVGLLSIVSLIYIVLVFSE